MTQLKQWFGFLAALFVLSAAIDLAGDDDPIVHEFKSGVLEVLGTRAGIAFLLLGTIGALVLRRIKASE